MQTWLLISLLLLAVIGLYPLIALLPASHIKRVQKAELLRRCAGKLVLSYDDGPGPLLTPPLLSLLNAHNVKASFYLVGFRADRFPETCDIIRTAGHDLGCHTHWHFNAWRVFPWTSARDVTHGYRSLTRWLPPHAAFRPPFGKLSTFSWFAAQSLRVPLAWWTADSGDTWSQLPDPQTIVNQILPPSSSNTAGQLRGGVVLLHSHDRGPDRQQYVLQITELLLARARELHMTVCTMADLLSFPSSSAPAHAH